MKKLMLFAVFLVVGQCVYAEMVLSVDLDVCRNDSVSIKYLALEDNYPTEFYRSGDYRLTIENDSGSSVYETSFGISFLLRSDPPVEVNCSKVSARIPYTANMRQISFYLKDRKIFSHPILLCNRNGRCETDSENYLSCPGDCPLDKTDGICIKDADGTCDPDCTPRVDPDCAAPSTEPVTTTREEATTIGKATTTTINVPLPNGNDKPSDILSYLPYALVLIVLVIATYFVHKKADDAKIKKERDEFLKWKEKKD